MANLGLTKNLVYGMGLGLTIAIVLQLLLNFFIHDYAYKDDYAKVFDGGALTAISIFLGVGWTKDKDEIRNMNLWHGLIILLAIGLSGFIAPLIVQGAVATLFGIFGAMSVYNFLAEDLLGGFRLGGLSVGLAAGLWNHIDSPFD
ncbi:hypothetical protein N9W71_05940 [Planktomarina temperata]|jgi:hypothetical protein|nr:hypothetical protein [Planktomarina temperata]